MAIKNYSYSISITKADLQSNELFWDQAHAMDDLWNAMVKIREDFLESVTDLYDKELLSEKKNEIVSNFRDRYEDYYLSLTEKRQQSVAGKDKPLLKVSELEYAHIKKIVWMKFDDDLTRQSNAEDFKTRIGWEAREAVLERFRAASSRAAKTGATLRYKPHRLTQVSFYHRFSGGGLETEKVFTGKSKKLKMTPVDEACYLNESHQNRKSRYSPTIFGIGLKDEPLKFSTYLHRQLPAGKIKVARFVGNFEELTRSWDWKLVLAIETPDVVPEMQKIQPIAALDLNWRRVDEHLRIGYVRDTAGNSFEIRLPIIEPLSRRAKNVVKVVNAARRHENKPPLEFKDLFPRNIIEIAEWSGRADELKDRLKTELKMIYEAVEKSERPAYAENFLQFYAKIGRRGLLKLAWQINENEHRSEADLKASELLEAYRQEDYRLRLSIHKTYKYLTNKRKKLYENLALWLSQNYSYLVWEGDLSLKEMAEAAPKISMNSEEIAIKLGNKYRQYAGLAILRGKIKEQNYNRDWLISEKSADSTRKCHICQAMCEVTSSIEIICPNGHVSDIDANSTANLLAKVPTNELIYSKSGEKIKIPAWLENNIIQVLS